MSVMGMVCDFKDGTTQEQAFGLLLIVLKFHFYVN